MTLPQEHEWFRVTLASIGDAVIATDTAGQVSFMNSVAEALTGWTSAEARGKPLDIVFNIINEYTRKPAPNPVGRVLREGIVVGLANHTVLISKGGAEYPIDDSAAPIRDPGGTIVGVVLVFHDITERKKTEAALMDSERRFRLMIDAVKDYALFMLDTTGRVASWNAGAERIKQYRAEEIIGSHFSRFYPPEDVQSGKPEWELKAAIKDGRVEDEGWRVRKDGSRFWANVVITAIRDEAGRLLGFAKVTRDVSERKKALEQLRVSEERFRLLIQGVKDYAIFMLTPEGRVASWNTGAQRINGYAPDEILGKSIAVFYPPEVVAAGKIERELVLAEKEGSFEEEGIRVRKDGSRFFADVILTAIKDDAGKLLGFAKVTRDITERKKAEQALRESNEELERRVQERTAELEKANRLKDNFLATLSHELRTPLTPMLGWARMIRSGQLDTAGVDRGIQVIERNVQLQTRIIEDLLDISRIVAGKLQIESKPVGLAQIIEAAMEVVRTSAEAKSIGFEFKMLGSVGPILGDPARLQQVVWNLLSNAIRFTPNHGKVTVELRKAGGQAELRIIDSGEGISAEYLPHVFERFSQADSSSRRRHGGLGIGLSIVKHLVEQHGGTVEASSPGLGKGATFTVRFPVSNQVLVPDAAYPLGSVATASKPLSGVRVMIVDDEHDSREFIQMVLTQFGADVLPIDSAAAALARIEAFAPDVLISDIGMPGQDGFDLIRALREREHPTGKVTPAVALTAFARAEDRQRALDSGFQVHLPKPVEPAELMRVVSQLARK